MADVPLSSVASSSAGAAAVSSTSTAMSWMASSTGPSGLSLHANAVFGWLLFNITRPPESVAARNSYESAFITQLQFELGQVTGVRQERIELGTIDVDWPDQLVATQMLPSTDPTESTPQQFADDLSWLVATNSSKLAAFTTTRQLRNATFQAFSTTLCLQSDGMLAYQPGPTCASAAAAASTDTMLLGMPLATTISLIAVLLVAILIGLLIFWYMRKSKREERDFLERAEAERQRLALRILHLQGGGNGDVELLIPPDTAVVPAAGAAATKSKPDKSAAKSKPNKQPVPALVPAPPLILPPSSPSRVEPPEIIPQWGSSLFIPQHLKSWAAIVTARTAGHEAPDAHEHKEPNLAHISAVKRHRQQQDIYRQKQKEQQEALLRQQLQAQHELQLAQQLQNPRTSDSPPPCTPRDQAAYDQGQGELADLDDDRQAEAADRDAPEDEDGAPNDDGDDGGTPPEEPEEQGHSSYSFDELPPQPSSTRTTDVHVSLAASPRADSLSLAQRQPQSTSQYQQQPQPQQYQQQAYQQPQPYQPPHSPPPDASWLPDPRARTRLGAAPSSPSGRYTYSTASPSGSTSAASPPPVEYSNDDRDVLVPHARASPPANTADAGPAYSPPPVRQMRAEPIRARRVPPSAIVAAVAATTIGPGLYSAPRVGPGVNGGAMRPTGGVLRPPSQHSPPPSQQFAVPISGGPNGVVMPARLATGQQPMVRLHGPPGSQQMPARSYVMAPPQQRALPRYA